MFMFVYFLYFMFVCILCLLQPVHESFCSIYHKVSQTKQKIVVERNPDYLEDNMCPLSNLLKDTMILAFTSYEYICQSV